MKLSVPVLSTAYYLMSMGDYQDPGNYAVENRSMFNPTEATCRFACDINPSCNQYVWQFWAHKAGVDGIYHRCWISPVLLVNIVAVSSSSYPTAMIVMSGQKLSTVPNPPTPLGPYESCLSRNQRPNLDPCTLSSNRLIAGLQPIGIPYIIALVVSYDEIYGAFDIKQPQFQTEVACRLGCSYNASCFQYIFQKDSTSLATTCYNLPYIVGVTLYSTPVPSTVSIVVGEKAWSLLAPIKSLSPPASQKNTKGRTRKNVKARTFSPAINQYYASCISRGLSQSAGTETSDSTCAAVDKGLLKAKNFA